MFVDNDTRSSAAALSTSPSGARRTFVELSPGGGGSMAGFAHTGERVEPLDVQLLDAPTASTWPGG